MDEQTIVNIFEKNQVCQQIVRIIADLDLPDCWLCAGYLRNYLWDHLNGRERFTMTDVDVVFFDPKIDWDQTVAIESRLKTAYPEIPWEVKNQALMHQYYFLGEQPYISTSDALAKFPERCTAVAIRLNGDHMETLAPFGWQDILDFRVRPTPHFSQNAQYLSLYRQRQAQKQWQKQWPMLNIEDI